MELDDLGPIVLGLGQQAFLLPFDLDHPRAHRVVPIALYNHVQQTLQLGVYLGHALGDLALPVEAEATQTLAFVHVGLHRLRHDVLVQEMRLQRAEHAIL
ncbi:hypothetical protein [Aureimonas sp. SK2]|uniref:hypothetical protein n=1 Tax=Aureimonas sp. SK2 TaxID=3015992 RepID=UPI0024440D24|nr:hypothetical protein [Aureimonas sp. SK2]